MVDSVEKEKMKGVDSRPVNQFNGNGRSKQKKKKGEGSLLLRLPLH